ncbi:MAG: hypothetical protein HRU71_01800 [Planctomycetia bacterium]|nr:MAG: hypothetical protein HRU71_01800 [Planctomycetia bacterium]
MLNERPGLRQAAVEKRFQRLGQQFGCQRFGCSDSSLFIGCMGLFHGRPGACAPRFDSCFVDAARRCMIEIRYGLRESTREQVLLAAGHQGFRKSSEQRFGFGRRTAFVSGKQSNRIVQPTFIESLRRTANSIISKAAEHGLGFRGLRFLNACRIVHYNRVRADRGLAHACTQERD